MTLRGQFKALATYIGLTLTLCECNYVNARSELTQQEVPSTRVILPSTLRIVQSYDIDHAVPLGDKRVTNDNLNLVSYNYRWPAAKRNQDFNSHEKMGQTFRLANGNLRRRRYAFVTDRVRTLNSNKDYDRNVKSHETRNTKDPQQTDMRYGLHLRPPEPVKRLTRNRDTNGQENATIATGNNNSKENAPKSVLSNQKMFENKGAHISDNEKVLQPHKMSVFNREFKNGIFSQGNVIDRDIDYQEESSEFVSRFTAEPTEYVYSSQRSGFVPVSGPFGNSGYYDRATSYQRRPQSIHDYSPTAYASQSRAETRSFYSTSRDLLGSGNFEILRGGTFLDNDDAMYPQQQHNDMLYEREVPYSNPVLGFQGFNHFSSHLHSALSKVVDVAEAPSVPRRTPKFLSTATFEAVP